MELKNPMEILLVLLSIVSISVAKVTLTTNGLTASVQNSHVRIDFKKDATVSSVTVGGKNIAAASNVKSFYLDWNNNGQGYFTPSQLVVVKHTDSEAHFYWLQKSTSKLFRIELHYVMIDDVSGIYSWAKYTNDQNVHLTLGETRTVYRFNPSIFTHGTNGAYTAKLYLYSYLNKQTKVQDETWKLPDGTYYSKYDFAGYIRETPYHGVYGNGYGAFVISGSREYHGGGPLKQDLLVHQDALVTNYFVSSHFGTPGLSAPPGWTHIYGPWLIYFNSGSDSAIIADVRQRATQEQSAWPKKFVEDAQYPYSRGIVSGEISGQKLATVVVYDSVEEQFDNQQLGYLYTANTDSKGYYKIEHVRPGNYKVVAYPIAGLGSDSFAEGTATVVAGQYAHVNLNLPEPSNILWSLGQANRRSNEFKYSNEPRNYLWETQPPATVNFVIGRSQPMNDWYYAQTKPGFWSIEFTDRPDGRPRTLRLGIAAASQSPHLIVTVNGHKIGDVYFANDQSIYRGAMQSGSYYSHVLQINNAQLVNGTNKLTFQMSKGLLMYDVVSLQRN